jgi:hypothetical protein
MEKETNPCDPARVKWQGNIALLKVHKRGGVARYDLALQGDGGVRVFYGVTEDGMSGKWLELLPPE